MKTTKQLGIWMDHSIAHLVSFTNGTVVTKTLKSPSAFPEQRQNLRMDETLMNNKEQSQLSDYFKILSDVIQDYEEVLLFGPTNAKNELFNLLKDDRHFEKIKIDVKSADKMTENQQQAFVKEFFSIPG